jgi:NAD/NADP transhydrogenase beta subunit
MITDDAQSIIIIPGYGLAVAQAYILHTQQNARRKELTSVAIHPLGARKTYEHPRAKVPHELLFEKWTSK